jgi:aspartate aminotransferase
MKISNKVAGIQLSAHRKVIAIAQRKRAEGKTVYNFSQGQPSLPPDQSALQAFCDRLLREPFETSRYSETRGLLDLRQAICADLKRYGGVDLVPDRVLLTDGAVEGLELSLSTLLEAGDSVAIFDPCYTVYWDLLRFLDLKAVPIAQRLDGGFQPDLEDIKRAAAQASAIVLCSPDNPTSRIISEKAAGAIADEVRDRNIPLLYDEAYKHILFEGEHVWMQKFSGIEDKLICLDSFSKELAIPGFRLGYCYGPREAIDQMAKVKAFTSICSPTPSQYLALEYLRRDIKEAYLKRALEVYRGRRDALYEAVKHMLPSAKVIKPVAGMYLFPDFRPYLDKAGLGDVEFCIRLAEEADVVAVPGSASGPHGEGHLRLCFIGEKEEKLRAGVQKMAEFLDPLL